MRFQRNPGFHKELVGSMQDDMDALAQEVVDEIHRSMLEPKSGRKYSRLPRTSAAPGESPAVQSGELYDSIGWETVDDLTRRVGTDSDIGLYQETGTRRMPAHPWLTPAILRVKQRRAR